MVSTGAGSIGAWRQHVCPNIFFPAFTEMIAIAGVTDILLRAHVALMDWEQVLLPPNKIRYL